MTAVPDKFDHDALDSIAGRFQRAGWLKGTTMVCKEGFCFDFSDKGYDRMMFMAEPIRQSKGGFVEELKKAVKLMWRIENTTRELRPPEFSKAERYYMPRLIAWFALRHAPSHAPLVLTDNPV